MEGLDKGGQGPTSGCCAIEEEEEEEEEEEDKESLFQIPLRRKGVVFSVP
jgi:hypothetical protein